MTRSGFGLFTALLCLALGCGGGGDGGGGGGGSTQILELQAPWSDHCVITFTESYEVRDFFGDVLFTAAEGDRFLLGGFGFGTEIEAYVMTADGPVEFEVATEPSAPFTTNCPEGTSETYNGVFANTTVYSDAGLTDVACELAAGTMAPASGSGYGFESDLAGGSAVYSVVLDGFSSECGGLEEGFIQVEPKTVFGTTTYLIPIRGFQSPSAG